MLTVFIIRELQGLDMLMAITMVHGRWNSKLQPIWQSNYYELFHFNLASMKPCEIWSRTDRRWRPEFLVKYKTSFKNMSHSYPCLIPVNSLQHTIGQNNLSNVRENPLIGGTTSRVVHWIFYDTRIDNVVTLMFTQQSCSNLQCSLTYCTVDKKRIYIASCLKSLLYKTIWFTEWVSFMPIS